MGASGAKIRSLALIGLLATAALAIASDALSKAPAPQNDPHQPFIGGEKGRNIAKLDCLSCHRGEGMYDPFVIIPILPKQLKVGEDADAAIQIVDTWKQDLRGFSANVQIAGPSTLFSIPGSAASTLLTQGDQEYQQQGTFYYRQDPPAPGQDAPLPDTLEIPFTVEGEVRSLSVNMTVAFHDTLQAPSLGPSVPDHEGKLNTRILGPGDTEGEYMQPDQLVEGSDPSQYHKRATERSYEANESKVQHKGLGLWKIRMSWEPEQVPNNSADYFVRVHIARGASSSIKSMPLTVDPTIHLVGHGDKARSTVLRFKMRGEAKGEQNITIVVRGEQYYAVKHQDRSTPNADNYTRVAERTITVGDTFIAGSAQIVNVGSVGLDTRLALGETVGFGSAILLLPSLALGGTFGRTSRRIVNALVGGAKRRVMFHNMVSLGLIITAVVHIILFATETRYSVEMGLLWGGLGSLGLLVLALSGYYQVPLIQRYGFGWWKNVHLWFGIGVVAFVAVHSLLDGFDFRFLSDGIPQAWKDYLNLAQG